MLELSYRQSKRLVAAVSAEGQRRAAAWQLWGGYRTAANPAEFRRRVLSLIKQKYSGSEEERFGPTLAAEHLAEEDGIAMDDETLRALDAGGTDCGAGSGSGRNIASGGERKAHFGELVQLDGSFHEWLEGRGPRGCLMNMVDDATSEDAGLVWGRKRRSGRRWECCGPGSRRYGVPQALYTDWKNVYVREATPGERLRGEDPVTQFGRMCRKLGIGIIAASSPQAKGRVERNHGTHQDRLVKKLRRKGIDQLRSREPISGTRVSAGAQPTLCPPGGEAGGLSRSEADGPRTA